MTPSKPKTPALIPYIGKGAFVPGVPARDLTEEEFSALSPDLQFLVAQSGLYQIAVIPQDGE